MRYQSTTKLNPQVTVTHRRLAQVTQRRISSFRSHRLLSQLRGRAVPPMMFPRLSAGHQNRRTDRNERSGHVKTPNSKSRTRGQACRSSKPHKDMASYCTMRLHHVCGYLRPDLRQESPNLKKTGRVKSRVNLHGTETCVRAQSYPFYAGIRHKEMNPGADNGSPRCVLSSDDVRKAPGYQLSQPEGFPVRKWQGPDTPEYGYPRTCRES